MQSGPSVLPVVSRVLNSRVWLSRDRAVRIAGGQGSTNMPQMLWMQQMEREIELAGSAIDRLKFLYPEL